MISKFFLLIALYFAIPAFALPIKNKQKNFFNEEKENNFYTSTLLKGNLYFTFGALESSELSEAFHFTYENKIRSTTSFNNSDKLIVIFESGNAQGSPLNLDLQSNKGDNLKLSSLYYQFPIEKDLKITVGPKMFGYMGLAGRSTLYNERIGILDGSNYSTSSGVGPGLGISIEKSNGLNASVKVASNKSEISKESLHYISQIGFTSPFIGGTITHNINEVFDAYGVAFYLRKNNLPSLSISLEEKKMVSGSKTKNWVFGLQKKYNNKTFGIATGTFDSDKRQLYEAWSNVQVSDKINIIPIVFLKDPNTKNDFGFAINTKFSY